MTKVNVIKYRNLVFVLVMSILTLGIYYLYWLYQTKEEINKMGGKIPSFILTFIPFVNIYFNYEYARYFVTTIQKEPENSSNILIYTIVLTFLPVICAVVIQGELNKMAAN